MNLEQAKKKLLEVSKSTATKHPKILIAELCGIIGFLLDEISRINSSTVTLHQRTLEFPKDGTFPRRPLRDFPRLPPKGPPPTYGNNTGDAE